MTVETDSAADFSLMKEILEQKNDTEVAVMGAFCEQVKDAFVAGCFGHLVVDNNQVFKVSFRYQSSSRSSGMPLTNSIPGRLFINFS